MGYYEIQTWEEDELSLRNLLPYNVLPTRQQGVSYTNNRGYTIFVTLQFTPTGQTDGGATIYKNNVVIGQAGLTGWAYYQGSDTNSTLVTVWQDASFTFPVPPGVSYKVVGDTPSIWVEEY